MNTNGSGEARTGCLVKEKRRYHALVNYNGRLLAMGGYDERGKPLSIVEEYEPRMDTTTNTTNAQNLMLFWIFMTATKWSPLEMGT